MTAPGPYDFLREQLTGMPPVPGLDQMGAAIHEPAADQRAYAQPERIRYMRGPGGTVVAVLDETPAPQTAPPAPAAYEAPPAAPVPDVWPKRLIAAGGSAAAVIGSIALAGPHLTEAGHAVEMSGIGVAAAGLGAGILVSLFKSGTSKTPVNVSVNVTSTSNSRSASASRSNHRNR